MQMSNLAYMINHCGCDKQVRERVSDEPELVMHATCHTVRRVIHDVCLMTSQLWNLRAPSHLSRIHYHGATARVAIIETRTV